MPERGRPTQLTGDTACLVPLHLDGRNSVLHVAVSSLSAKCQEGVCVLVGGPRDEVSHEDGEWNSA